VVPAVPRVVPGRFQVLGQGLQLLGQGLKLTRALFPVLAVSQHQERDLAHRQDLTVRHDADGQDVDSHGQAQAVAVKA
jgi:hypothetical protein